MSNLKVTKKCCFMAKIIKWIYGDNQKNEIKNFDFIQLILIR